MKHSDDVTVQNSESEGKNPAGKSTDRPLTIQKQGLAEHIMQSLSMLLILSWLLFRFHSYILMGIIALFTSINLVFMRKRKGQVKSKQSISDVVYYIIYFVFSVVLLLAFTFLLVLPIYSYGIVSLPGIVVIALWVLFSMSSWRKHGYRGFWLSLRYPLFIAIITFLPLFQVTKWDKYGILAFTAVLLLAFDLALSKMKKVL